MKNKKENITCVAKYNKNGEFYFVFKSKKNENLLIHRVGKNKVSEVSVKNLKKHFTKINLTKGHILFFEVENKITMLNDNICHNPSYYIHKIEKDRTEKNCKKCFFFSLCISYDKLI